MNKPGRGIIEESMKGKEEGEEGKGGEGGEGGEGGKGEEGGEGGWTLRVTVGGEWLLALLCATKKVH